jgi:DNA primase
MIPAVEVARVKNGTNLVVLIQSKGIELKKKGRSWQGRCPFHADGKTPSLSVTPEKGLWAWVATRSDLSRCTTS